MAILKITMVDGSSSEHKITPVIEYAFEQYKGKGFHKALIDDNRQSDIYWLAWECLRRSGVTVKIFGEPFIETLASVDVLDDSPKE